ncbi:hypothetical protein F511_41328 [Dorcoceras hygrometricum]|uniref:Uncharacterized protein n=1 Tax=Dorcoceras hygrometricum TaxID=472368 RepID=A0A2Z7BM85_9LAMI|nr:hypothetical protein F511_41328 [Dorcoceras hygrometricum]
MGLNRPNGLGNHESSTCVTLNGSGIQLAVGPQPLWLRNHNFELAQRIMVKRLATSPHDPLGITDSACKNQLVVVSVQYGPFNTYIPIRSTTIDSIGYPRIKASGESSTTKHRLIHASGPHPIPPPNDSKGLRRAFHLYQVVLTTSIAPIPSSPPLAARRQLRDAAVAARRLQNSFRLSRCEDSVREIFTGFLVQNIEGIEISVMDRIRHSSIFEGPFLSWTGRSRAPSHQRASETDLFGYKYPTSPILPPRKVPLEEFDPQTQSPSLTPGELLASTNAHRPQLVSN